MANAGFLILGLLFGVLSLVGFLNAVRGTPVKKVKGFLSELPPVDDECFRVAMELTSHTTMAGGNHVEVFWNGDQTYPRLWKDLRSAKQSITLQLYYNKPGRMADELSDILCERARAGVKVLFLYDAFGTSFKKEYLKKLRDTGVRAERFRPMTLQALNKVQHRAHIRVVVYAIASARRKLYITNSYFVPDRDIRALLIDAAQRGVDMRVLTVSGATDIRSTWYAGRARYEQLLRGGVRIFEYQPVMMHAKTLVADGFFSAVGSMNADNRSLSLNEETVLMTLDSGVAATVEQHFCDDLKFSKEIELEEFRRRPVMDKFKERVCYAFWRIL